VETEELSTYGWVDEEQGVVRIPIDRAMDLLVKEAVPPPAPPAAAGQGEDE
jgi:hypothetical protein